MTSLDKLLQFNPAGGGHLSDAANSVRSQTAQVMADGQKLATEALKEYERQETVRWAAVAHLFALAANQLGGESSEMATALISNFDSIRTGLNELHRLFDKSLRANEERWDVVLREINYLHIESHVAHRKLGLHDGGATDGITSATAPGGTADGTSGATIGAAVAA